MEEVGSDGRAGFVDGDEFPDKNMDDGELPDRNMEDDDVEVSSDDDSVDENAYATEISAAETELSVNPYKYDQHVLLIDLLKKSGDLEKLREARRRMSDIFPLTEALWLDWLRDEMRLAAITESEKQAVLELFERAVKDYLSVNIWLEYSQFTIGLMGEEGGMEKCRGVMERALVAAGLHVSDGSILWEVYREFEFAILSTMMHDGEISENEKEEVDRQKSRVMNLFKRQLSVPLQEMEKTFVELNDWLPSNQVDPNIKLGYNKALSKLKKISKYEEILLAAEPPTESVYLEYLEFELKEGEPARIQCLYERAIVDNCLSPSLWEQYVRYLDSQLKIAVVVLPVYERAVRNCPWSVKLWQGYLRALERYLEPRDKVKELAERALMAGFTSADEYRELWLTYLEYLRRQIDWSQDHDEALEILRATFERAHSHLMDGFGLDGDPDCSVLKYWARIEGRHCKNMERSREIWIDIINLGHGHRAQMWLEQCTLERAHGDAKHARKLFARGLMAAADWPESIGESWLQFEKDEGSLDQLETAILKIESRMKVIQERRIQESNVDQRVGPINVGTDSSKRLAKRKQPSNVDLKSPVTKHSKKRKVDDPEKVVTQFQSNIDSDGYRIPAVPTTAKKRTRLSQDEPKKKKSSKRTTDEKSLPRVGEDIARDERSIFLSNLSFEVDENKIKEFFLEISEVKDVRLVHDRNGRSRGFGYVEFPDKDFALKALKKDREILNGRPAFVSKCEEKSKRTNASKFKYSESIERNKLFVKGLPFSSTQQDVTEVFKTYGDLKEVRLVTYRNGNSKGFAFVEYNDAKTATFAQSKTDGMVIDGHTLTVAISNPSERKRTDVGDLQLPTGSGDSAGQRTRSRTQISLVPRSLMRKSPTAMVATNGSSKPMNNDQFRDMLLSKK